MLKDLHHEYTIHWFHSFEHALRRTDTQVDVIPQIIVEPIDDVESNKLSRVEPVADQPRYGAGSTSDIQPTQAAAGPSVFDR
jgi:hypothetical protein